MSMRRMPEAVDPMLCTPVDKPFRDPEWLFEMKWDGERAIAFVGRSGRKGKVKMTSRLHNDITAKYPEIAGDLGSCLRAKGAVIDGEIVALNKKGRADFGILQRRMGLVGETDIAAAMRAFPASYVAFDLLWLDGKDLTGLPLEKRRSLLEGIIGGCTKVKFSEAFDDGEALLEAVRVMEGEGIIAKRRDSTYRQGVRGREWLKIKIVAEQECVIGGWTEGKGRRSTGFGALVLGLYEKKGGKRILTPVGSVGTGFDDDAIRALLAKLRRIERKRMPFAAPPVLNGRPHWTKPSLVAQVRFANWTEDGQMRAPVFLGLRSDKKPEDCVREVPKRR